MEGRSLLELVGYNPTTACFELREDMVIAFLRDIKLLKILGEIKKDGKQARIGQILSDVKADANEYLLLDRLGLKAGKWSK